MGKEKPWPHLEACLWTMMLSALVAKSVGSWQFSLVEDLHWLAVPIYLELCNSPPSWGAWALVCGAFGMMRPRSSERNLAASQHFSNLNTRCFSRSPSFSPPISCCHIRARTRAHWWRLTRGGVCPCSSESILTEVLGKYFSLVAVHGNRILIFGL